MNTSGSILPSLKSYIGSLKDTLIEEAVIGLFLNNVRKSLKVHAVGIKRSKPSWDAFLRAITKLDIGELRDASLVKGGFSR